MKLLRNSLRQWHAAAKKWLRSKPWLVFAKRLRQGFSLVQMSVILAVAGIAISASVPGDKAGSNNEKYLASMNRLGNNVQRAFTAFRAKYGRLPCPADGTLSIDNVNAGKEADIPGACTGGATEANFAQGDVVGGIIPYATLGLQERQVRDQWGRWITYVVDKRSTDADLCLLLTEGAVVINDYGTDVNAMFTFIVHGPSGQGAFVPVRGSNTGTRLKPDLSDADALKNASLDGAGEDAFTGEFVKKDLIPGTFESFVWIPPNSNVCCFGFSGCYKCNASVIGSDNNHKISNVISSSGNNAGMTVAAGDINGDGVADLITGAPNTSSNRGAVYVNFGSPTMGDPVNVGALNGSNGFVITGQAAGDYFGTSVALGDVNGDGLRDIIVGAPEATSGAGKLYVFFSHGSYSASYTAASLINGSSGFVITGPAGEKLGYSVASGHVKGNGFADIVVSGKGVSNSNKGAAYVIWGGASWSATTTLASMIDNTGSVAVKVAGSGGDTYGWTLATGDINGDSFDDVLMTNPNNRAYAMFGIGVWAADLTTASLTGNTGKQFVNHAQSTPGQQIAALDFNGDGISDVAIASNVSNLFDSGIAGYVLYGSVTAKASWPNSFDLTSVDNSSTPAGFKVESGYTASFVGGGDVDSDGSDDLIVGQPTFDGEVDPNTGRIVLLYGTPSMTDAFNLDATPSAIDGEQAAAVNGKEENGYFGYSATVEDIRQDNGNDVAIAIPFSDDEGTTDNGRVQIMGRCKWRCGNLFGDGTYYGGGPPANCDTSQCQGTLPCVIEW